MENQCLGLASALGIDPVVKRIKLRTPWRQLSPFFRLGLKSAMSEEGDVIEPPWPDLLIATGRASIPASLLVKRMSRKTGHETFTVQIQNPVIDASRFDLVVVPRHDIFTGANVMTTRGSLHRVTKELLEREAQKFLPKISHLPQPYTGVLIGGSNAVYELTPKEMEIIARQLADLSSHTGSLLITPSRRTGSENIRILKKALKPTPHYVWDWDGVEPNPYYGILGVCQNVIATCDSVGMITEACSTGKPVMVIDLPGGSDKFRRFHSTMRDEGLTRTFRGKIEEWQPHAVDDTKLVADRILELIGKH